MPALAVSQYYDAYSKIMMTRNSKILVAAIASLLLTPLCHGAISITTNTGTGGISGLVRDDAGASGAQFPATLNVKNNAGAGHPNPQNTRKVYMRFDVSSLSFSVTTATLSLEAHNFSLSTGETRTISVYGLNDGANDSWSSAMVWSDAVANDTNSGSGFTSAATLLGTFSLDENDAAGDFFDFSTTALKDFINSDTNDLVTIMLSAELSGNDTTDGRNTVFAGDLTDDGGGGFRMAPTLTLIPEPSSAALFGLMGTCLLLRRKRCS